MAVPPRQDAGETKLSVRISREKRNKLKALASLEDKSVQEFLGEMITRELDHGSVRLSSLGASPAPS